MDDYSEALIPIKVLPFSTNVGSKLASITSSE